ALSLYLRAIVMLLWLNATTAQVVTIRRGIPAREALSSCGRLLVAETGESAPLSPLAFAEPAPANAGGQALSIHN
ncbi:hypothetical protein KKE26_00940, partial [bacterium]|nr:hypothetical protein [bacterium]